MKIICPACDATYEVPETVVTSRRQVRCARCGNNWAPGDAMADVAAAQEAGSAAPLAGDGTSSGRSVTAVEPEPPAEAAWEQAEEPAHIAGAHAAPAGHSIPHDSADDPPGVVSPAPHAPDVQVPAAEFPDVEASEFESSAPAEEAVEQAEEPAHFRPMTPRGLTQPAPLAALPAAEPAPGAPAAAWAGSIAAVVAILVALVVFRAPVMHAWPPSTRLYAALGFYRP